MGKNKNHHHHGSKHPSSLPVQSASKNYSKKSSSNNTNARQHHSHPLGNKARESDERRIFLRNKIEIKRLLTNVEKQKAILKGEALPPTSSERKRYEDDLYQLKGAARPAFEHYAPKVEEIPTPKDLLTEYHGRLWEVIEGQDYLTALFEYAASLHNLMNKSKDALTIFHEMLELDIEDHLRVKEQILRCYLDNADAVNARILLEKYSNDHCSFFMYSRALIEYLSVHLQEKGSSEQLRDQALEKAIVVNPFIIWLIAYYDIFEIILEENSEDLLEEIIQSNLNIPGSIEEAFTFFKNDIGIWMEIEGIVEWMNNYIVEHELTPPEVTIILPEGEGEEEEMDAETPEKQLEFFHAMYLDMFKTGCEEIEERLIGGGEGRGEEEEEESDSNQD